MRELSSFLLLTATIHLAFGYWYHQEVPIKRRQTHCIYHLLQDRNIATFEVLINDSDNEGALSALGKIEGPIAPAEINAESSEVGDNRNNGMGAQLQKKIEAWPSFLAGHRRNFQKIGMIHHSFHIDFTDSAIVDGYIDTPRKSSSEKRRIEEEARKREAGEEVYEESNKIEWIEPEAFEPYEWTKAIKTGGWYRLCVQAEDSNIYVEMDIRSSAELGGVDDDTNHVYTRQKKEELDERNTILLDDDDGNESKEAKRLAEEQLRQEVEAAVKDYDLEATKKLMSEMNSLVMQLQQRQGAMLKRSKGHEMQARRNYKRIARSGMIETLLYLVITGFQVYTIHSWLLRNSLLGR